MSNKLINKILLLFAGAPIIPMKPQLTGIEYFNLNTFTGLDIGWLKWPTLIGVIFAVLAFVIGTFYLAKYSKGFYAGRSVPKSWNFMLWGIFITAIAEIGEITVFYELPRVGIIETMLLTMIPHILGGILIALGSYFLYKEVTE